MCFLASLSSPTFPEAQSPTPVPPAPLRASLKPVLSYSLPRRWHPLPTEVPKETAAAA